MKIVFDKAELEWLNVVVTRLLLIANGRKEEDDGALLRLAAKMRHKFTPNSSVTYLTRPERQLIYRLAEHRALSLAEGTAMPLEEGLVQGIMDKVAFAKDSS